MANTQVTLIWRCKTEAGWRQFKAVMGTNGKVRKGVVVVGEPPQEKHYPEGRFQLRYYEGAKMVYKDVGTESSKALDEKWVRENLLAARTTAAAAGVQIVEDPTRKTLKKAYAAFLQATEDRGSTEAVVVYRTALDEFFQVVRKTYVDELTVEDMLKYQRHLRERRDDKGKQFYADRTIYNRWANTKAFFLYCGFDSKKMLREDGEAGRLVAPKYEEQTPETYEPEEIEQIFKAIQSAPRENAAASFYAACQIMLKCGLREQEVCHLEWKNLNLKRGILHVEGNPTYDFKVKDSEQRDIPIPQKLVEWLQTYRHAHPKNRLVCPTSSDKPNGKLLRTLKRHAERAGLNCGVCESCKKSNECEHWFLHKFRATCITMWLRAESMGGAGLDLRTVMSLSGHADLASVMRYLSPASNASVRKGVDRIEWGD